MLGFLGFTLIWGLSELRGWSLARRREVMTIWCMLLVIASLPGVFPPLAGSEWVQGDTRTLANILLHGVNGEISVMGNTYSGAMPAFAQLGDAELAAVATYIRSAWSNKAEALPVTLVEQERKAGSARTGPFEGGAALKALAEKPS